MSDTRGCNDVYYVGGVVNYDNERGVRLGSGGADGDRDDDDVSDTVAAEVPPLCSYREDPRLSLSQ